MEEDNKKIVIVSDVDGVLTDGHFYYSSYGKILKQFVFNITLMEKSIFVHLIKMVSKSQDED